MVAYGRAFQERLAPRLEDVQVQSVEQVADGFRLVLAGGERARVRQVIIAVGYSHYQYVPETLAHLPAEFLSHSSQQRDLSRFRGRHVTVIGGGASALDVSALLHEAGADVELLARRSALVFGSTPRKRTAWDRVRAPITLLGSGWKSVAYCDLPGFFRYLPRETRIGLVKNTLGPAGGWAMKERVLGRFPLLLAHTPRNAEVRSRRVHLRAFDAAGSEAEVVTDHVIAATGYRVDVRRLNFVADDIRSRLECEDYVPVLSRNFESSIPGMYFVGLAAANYFGPVMRFVAGAEYTSKKLAAHLSRKVARG
jgi:thioredoxin reductase